MNVLFICNQNQHRSKTAEHLFKDMFNTKSAGLYNDHPLSEQQLSWADIVFVMEESHRKEIAKRFPRLYMQKRILCLDVPDVYHFDQPELIVVLKQKVDEMLHIIAA